MRTKSLLALLPSLLLLSCTSDDGPPDAAVTCFVGDPGAPPEMQLVHHTASGQPLAFTDNGTVPLILPPQGGKVMLVGVRAKNLDGCPLTIATALIDPCTQAVVALERRPVLMEEQADGWLAPLQPAEISNYSNLPACPRANLTRDVHGQAYELVVSIEDKAKRKVERRVMITPTCNQPEFQEQCECECSQGYTLGGTCDPTQDAGVAATCDAGI